MLAAVFSSATANSTGDGIGEQRLVVEQLVPGEVDGVGHHAGAVVHHHEVA